MKIGGDFEFVQYQKKVKDSLHDYLVNKFSNLQYFTSGRSGIFALFNYLLSGNLIISNIYLPAYICESIYFPILKAINKKSVQIFFYQQNDNLESKLEPLLNNSIIYVVDYFGKTDHSLIDKVLQSKRKYPNTILIRDITHALFCSCDNYEVDYYICSLRKWTFLPDGAFVASHLHEVPTPSRIADDKFIQARLIASKLKSLNISYNPNVFKDEYYLDIFQFCEKELDNYIDSIKMSNISAELLRKIDYQSLIKKREQNRNYLLKNLSSFKQFSIINESGLYSVTLLFNNPNERDNFRSKMKALNIFFPIHWPVEWQKKLQGFNEILLKRSEEISSRILSLVIDQRYGIQEMKYIINGIKGILEENP